MSHILIAESGSTKTDWYVVGKKSDTIACCKTSGINPYLQSPDEIMSVFKEIDPSIIPQKLSHIFYYGAGASSEANQQLLTDLLRQFFGVKKIEVQGDMMAAARALCSDKKGIVCILGTGSNSCYYDGKTIREQQASLGYIAGDEGSGNHMGKKVLQYYAYNTFDTELKMAFEMHFGNNLQAIVQTLYRKPFPNRYLANMVRILTENRGHYMVENIIEDCLNDFFHNHVLKYRQSWKQPIHFAGSVAYCFKDVIEEMVQQCEMEMGEIVQSPIEGLIKYHTQEAFAK